MREESKQKQMLTIRGGDKEHRGAEERRGEWETRRRILLTESDNSR